MDRLTTRIKNGIATKPVLPDEVADINLEKHKTFYEIIEKLAHYEDLEEQLMESAEIDIDNMVGEFMHYYNLKKENRLIELPCAVGSRVYFILENDEIDNQLIDNVQTALFFKDLNGNLKKGFYRTKEEAARKLEELKGE